MKNIEKGRIKQYVFYIVIAVIGGAVTGLLNMSGMEAYKTMAAKPPLTPPPIVFPIVWTVLYTLMGAGAAMVKNSGGEKSDLFIFWAQLFVNYAWTFLFFGFEAYFASFLWLILLLALAVIMARDFYKVNKTAGLIQIPYILWITFAGYLNFGVWLLNR